MTPRKTSSDRQSRTRPANGTFDSWIDFGLFAGGALLVAAFLHLTMPRFGVVTYHYGNLPDQRTHLPLLVDTADPTLHVKVAMDAGYFAPGHFLVKPDDCIEQMTVNNIVVPPPVANFCDYDAGKVLDLGRYIRPGANVFSFRIHDDGGKGGINISVANNDPLQMGALSIFVLLFLWYACTLVKHLRVPPGSRLLAGVFISGMVLRVMYVIATPFRLRSYDVDGHLDYITFIRKNWSIPLANNGWEFHQPPLYYWLSAVWAHLNALAGRVGDKIYGDLQIASLFLSGAALLASLWMAQLLFQRKTLRKGGDVLFLLLIAVLPGLAMFSSRVTNESLYHFLAFLGLALLLSWWRYGQMRDWYLAVIVIILGSLAKISAAGLFPVAFLCLLVRRDLPWRPKLKHFAAGTLIVLALFAWYPVKRFTERNLANVVTLGNRDMNPDLAVKRTASSYLVFNPVQVARLPFNDTWSDQYRRRYFWEFFFKSSFFGEFRFEKLTPLAAVMVSLGMLLLPMLVLGLVLDLWKRFYEMLPLTLTMGILTAAALAYPTLFPYAPNQDFRFSVLLAVPFTYFAVRGVLALPTLLRYVFIGVILALACACALFFGAMYMHLY